MKSNNQEWRRADGQMEMKAGSYSREEEEEEARWIGVVDGTRQCAISSPRRAQGRWHYVNLDSRPIRPAWPPQRQPTNPARSQNTQTPTRKRAGWALSVTGHNLLNEGTLARYRNHILLYLFIFVKNAGAHSIDFNSSLVPCIAHVSRALRVSDGPGTVPSNALWFRMQTKLVPSEAACLKAAGPAGGGWIVSAAPGLTAPRLGWTSTLTAGRCLRTEFRTKRDKKTRDAG